MPFMPTDCALAIGTLFHALPAVQPDSVIAGMPASVFGNVVSGVVGSVITLGGVLLSNWHGRGLKREELKHDATQRNHEREMMLRREVFLPAVEAALTMQASIGTLVNIEIPAVVASEKYQAGHATFIKVAAIGTQETVLACQALNGALGNSLLQLSARRAGLQHLQNQLADLDRNTTLHEGLRDSWIKVQQELVAKGEKDAEVWQAARPSAAALLANDNWRTVKWPGSCSSMSRHSVRCFHLHCSRCAAKCNFRWMKQLFSNATTRCGTSS
jgi:hypothetical protein